MTDAVLPIGSLGVTLILAALTYFWRSAGFWTMGRVPMSPRLKRGLDALPGAIVVSTVLPLVAQTGAVAALAVGAAALSAVVLRNEFATVVVGAAVAAAARLVF